MGSLEKKKSVNFYEVFANKLPYNYKRDDLWFMMFTIRLKAECSKYLELWKKNPELYRPLTATIKLHRELQTLFNRVESKLGELEEADRVFTIKSLVDPKTRQSLEILLAMSLTALRDAEIGQPEKNRVGRPNVNPRIALILYSALVWVKRNRSLADKIGHYIKPMGELQISLDKEFGQDAYNALGIPTPDFGETYWERKAKPSLRRFAMEQVKADHNLENIKSQKAIDEYFNSVVKSFGSMLEKF